MEMSDGGVRALMQREGVRLVAYPDTVGVWTIGVGHSSLAGTPPPVTPGMRITRTQALQILAGDLKPRAALLTSLLKRPATQNQFDALLSLMFNIGNGGFMHSDVLRHFNAGDVQGAADAFMHWSHPAALSSRRSAERRQFLGG